MASIYFAQRYPDAKIIAVEAEASNFSVLVRNVQPYPAIIPVHAALWNRDGQISVREPNPATGAHGKWGYVTQEGPGPRVRAVTMRTLMREMRVQAIDLVKIDIEGAEQEVFEDHQWLAGTGCLMIELHDRFRPGCLEAVEPAMRGFTHTQRGETTFYIREASGQAHVYALAEIFNDGEPKIAYPQESGFCIAFPISSERAASAIPPGSK